MSIILRNFICGSLGFLCVVMILYCYCDVARFLYCKIKEFIKERKNKK